MVSFSTVFVASVVFAAQVSAAPLQHQKRINQIIAESTADWEQACIAAGGAQQCNPISQTAFTSLLAAGGNCAQQDAADLMVDLAKTLDNDPEMIRLAQLFVQQPRNAPDSLQVPYCQTAPKNAELDGLFHCQFAGSDFTKFSGDQTGNLPLGVAAVNPAGSCPANTAGPIPDGVQLNTLTDDPGNGGAAAPAPVPAPAPVLVAPAPVLVAPAPVLVAPVENATPSPALAAPAAGKDFTLSNGQKAQQLNAQFAFLTAASPCTDGDQACVAGGFAQCVGGKFAITNCAGGTQCFALPLVNSAGTSITCSTQADAIARIANTGATGGLTGGAAAAAPAQNAVPKPVKAALPTPAPATNAPAANAKPFTLQNGRDALAQNAKFAALSAASPCTAGENACVNGGFAQCVAGKFVVTGCAGGLTCAALPLVNSAGTSITCTTPADVTARIAATGAA